MPSTFTHVMADQREEEQQLLERRLVQRDALQGLRDLVEEGRIVVVTGPRRSGKSTLALTALAERDHLYIDFDDERLAGLGARDLNAVLEAAVEVYGPSKYVLLDEVQNVTGWELLANRLQRRGWRVVVTGSSAGLLSRELATHLAGRHATLALLPFSFREHVRWRGEERPAGRALSTEDRAAAKRLLEEHIQLGGFPEAVASPNPRSVLRHIYDDAVVKDAILRYGIRYTRAFRELARDVLSSYSCLVSRSRLRARHGLRSLHTVRNYVQYLEDAYLVLSLDGYSHKVRELGPSPKKVYGIDTGLVRHVAFSPGPDLGRLLENIVAVELLGRSLARPGTELYHWRGPGGREVDFVVRVDGRVERLVQVCYDPGSLAADRELAALAAASKHLRCRELVVVTWDAEGEERAGGLRARLVPAWRWLLGQEG